LAHACIFRLTKGACTIRHQPLSSAFCLVKISLASLTPHATRVIIRIAEVYEGLRTVIGPRKISRFIEDLVRPHVVKKDMYAAYKEMAADQIRESEALEWAEGTIGDLSDEER